MVARFIAPNHTLEGQDIAMRKTRVLIWGSCVSRDTFSYLPPDEFELVRYIARQSVISAYSKPVELVERPVLESNFQTRMLAGDFASSAEAELRENAPNVDLLLVDLVDERLGVYVLPDGSVITRSVELISSGFELELPSGSRYIPFGSDAHFDYWSAGIAAIAGVISQTMPHAAIGLIDVPWAVMTDVGEPVPDSFGVSPQAANATYPRYVAYAAKALGAKIITSGCPVTADSRHTWGIAPFHYVSSVYRALVVNLLSIDEVSDGCRGQTTSRATTSTGKPDEPPRSQVRDITFPFPGAQDSRPMRPERVVVDDAVLGRLTAYHIFSRVADEKSRWRTGKDSLSISRTAAIEEYSTFAVGSTLFTIGAFSTSYSLMPANTVVGRYSTILPRAFRTSGGPPVERFTTSNLTVRRNQAAMRTFLKNCSNDMFSVVPNARANTGAVVIGNDVWVADGVTFDAPKVDLGDGCIVRAGSVVTEDVPPFAIVAGVPARVVGYRFNPEVIARLLKLRWWDYNIADFGPIRPDGPIEAFLDQMENRVSQGRLQLLVLPVHTWLEIKQGASES